ncbi:hypothetical protein PIB30_085882, partial [Stylosanthes scabra]|nr:hypothetical protein [Stylosanthes scabra]
LFRYRFELGKLAKHSSGVFGLASPQIESSVVFCRRISEVCPEYVIGFRELVLYQSSSGACGLVLRASKRLRELFHEIRKKGAPHGWIPEDIFARLVEFWRQDDFKKLQQTNTKSRASETGESMHTGGSTTYLATRERMFIEMGRTPSFSEVFVRTHTCKKDCYEWVDKRSHDCKVDSTSLLRLTSLTTLFEVEKNRLEVERQAIIVAGGPEPPPIDEETIWLQIAGGRKKGRIYGKGVVPAYYVPLIIGDVDDADTASDPSDVREQVTLLNRELSQQAEASRQRVAQVEAVCEQKVRTLEMALESQSQEVSQLRKAYSDMYSFLELMHSGGFGSASFTAMLPPPPSPPPPPPRARSPSPPPQQDRAASPSQHDDDLDYV